MPTAMSINTHAQIVQLDDGSIRVFYEGVKYAKNQIVPSHIFGVDSNPESYTTAEGFVKTIMLAKYGNNLGNWPGLALAFLKSEQQ